MTIRWSPTKSAPRPLQSANQAPVRAQMPQCCLPLSYFLVEARQIVVCVRQLFVQRDCPAVGCNRGIGALQIFEGGAEVKGGGCVLGGEPKGFLILENGFLHPPSLLEQPAEVDVRVGISRGERQRTGGQRLRCVSAFRGSSARARRYASSASLGSTASSSSPRPNQSSAESVSS